MRRGGKRPEPLRSSDDELVGHEGHLVRVVVPVPQHGRPGAAFSTAPGMGTMTHGVGFSVASRCKGAHLVNGEN